MLFRRNTGNDDTLDYEVPMENELDNIDDDTPTHNGQRPSHLHFDPWKKNQRDAERHQQIEREHRLN